MGIAVLYEGDSVDVGYGCGEIIVPKISGFCVTKRYLASTFAGEIVDEINCGG
jgi:hypothetical protein